jgi:hypothetical protein
LQINAQLAGSFASDVPIAERPRDDPPLKPGNKIINP